MPVMPDTKGTSFSGYGNSAYTMRVYSIDPENPEETIKLLPRVPMGQVKNVYKALYPSNRWRDFHDFNAVSVYVPEMCFLAPDGKLSFLIISTCHVVLPCWKPIRESLSIHLMNMTAEW